MRGRGRLLGDPRFTGAVALLAVNDHVLKGWAPGPLTGKLSDVAGVFVVAVVVGVVTGRARLAVGLTGVAFAALKTVPAAATLAVPALGGVTRRDPTDLVALAALLPAHRFLSARLDAAPPARLAPLLGTAAAVLAVTATSCLPVPAVQAFQVGDDGTVVALVGEHGGVPDEELDAEWAISRDGGATWSATEAPPRQGGAGVPVTDRACSPAAGCYRVRDDRVEQGPEPSGPYRTVFAYSGEQRERIRQRQEGCGAVTDDGFRSVALVPRPDGDHVVVAMGTQGVLHRRPDGEWERVAVLDCRPASLAGPSWLLDLAWISPIALVLTGSVALLPVRRRRPAGMTPAAVRSWWRSLMVLLWVGGGIGLFQLAGALMWFEVDYAVSGPLIAGVATAAFLVTVVAARRRLPPRRLLLPPPPVLPPPPLPPSPPAG